MLALLSVWIGLISFILALLMVIHRSTFTDLTVVLVLYFGSPGALCLAGLVLWSLRKEGRTDGMVRAQRLQAKIAVGMALAAATLVYLVIIFSQKIDRVEG